MNTKKQLRKYAKEIRKSLKMDEISDKIVKNIKTLNFYKESKNVMIFYPLEHEVNLLGLLDEDKNFYLPKVQSEDMLVCPYQKGDELTASEFKTMEPKTSPVNPEILDIIFVPALMVDKACHRLGYGGGFYDKFLSKNKIKAKKIVAIPNALMVDKLPSEDFDAKIDVTICENFL